jgi:type VI secretion system protein ImpG
MDTRLLEYYNRELRYLRDLGGEFAREFPKVSQRLGLDSFECADPYVERLLEGFAFMAARVQLKIDSEFPSFTEHLLEMLCPHYLCPTPSMVVVQLRPDPAQGTLNDGFPVVRGTALTSNVGRADTTACEYRTAHDVTLWPVEIVSVSHTGVAPGREPLLSPRRPVKGALRIRLRTTNGLPFSALGLDRLPLFIRGTDAVSLRLFELLSCSGVGMLLREPGGSGTGTVVEAPVRVLGLDDKEALLPCGPRTFHGYRLLHEYFAFPSRYLFVELLDLAKGVRQCPGKELEIVLALDRHEPTLEAAINAANVSLFCTPAINLFPKKADRIHLDDGDSEYHVVVDRARPMDFEVFSVVDVAGFGSKGEARREFAPLYQRRAEPAVQEASSFYTLQRRPRMASSRQKTQGPRSSYLGSEVFVSLVDGPQGPYGADLRQLGISALCTNRDLPLRMPVGDGRTDFFVESGAPVQSVRCVAGPSAPRPSHAWGETSWRLISHLTLNYLSLVDAPDEKGATALREMLSLYGEPGRASPADGRARQLRARRRSDARVRRNRVRRHERGAARPGARSLPFQVCLHQFLHRNRAAQRSAWRDRSMASSDRTAADDLSWAERLELDAGSFDFRVALRRFESSHAGKPRLGEALRPADEPLRIGQEPSLSFEPSAITSFTPERDQSVARLGVAFMGLWGPNGPLPTHLTEYARQRSRNAGDRTLTSFVDIFHHRMLLLFYRAWAKAQPTVAMDRAPNAFSLYLGAFLGLGLHATGGRDAFPDHAKLFYAGRFGASARNAEGLREVVADYFQVPVAVEEFVGSWAELPAESCLRLRGDPATATLGRTAVLGRRVFTRAHKFRITLGPLSRLDFERTLPASDALTTLEAIVRLYTNDEWAWDVRLVLSPEATEPAALGRGGRLGWTTRIGGAHGAREDLIVDPLLKRTSRLQKSPSVS